MVEEIDWSTGEILGALKKHGLDKQTLVMFSSDNGPWYQGSPGQLRGRKGTTWEGGAAGAVHRALPGAHSAGTDVPRGGLGDGHPADAGRSVRRAGAARTRRTASTSGP